MRALIRTEGGLQLERVAAPRIGRPDEVRVEVAYAGLCRTDLHVASGRIPVDEPRVLGHEAAGVVVAAGPAADVEPGRRVALMPWVDCGECRECRAGQRHRCARGAMLGVGRDGAFAEQVVVPSRCAFPIPDTLDLRLAAYAEPLCAAMAVLEIGLDPRRPCVVAGSGRIAELTMRVLRAAGHHDSILWQPGVEPPPAPLSLDQAVEAATSSEVLAVLVAALRPGATLVLKSRPESPLTFDVATAVQRELIIRCARYGRFEDALAWLAEPPEGLELSDLLGATYPLDDAERAFADAARERSKCFFAPGEESC